MLESWKLTKRVSDMKRLFATMFLSFSSLLLAVDPDLIGGRPIAKGEFPEIVYIRSGLSRCTATIVSDQVIITAAHCVKDEGIIQPVLAQDVDFVIEQIIYKAMCNQAPLYRDKLEDHDLALCITDKKMNIKPASVLVKKPLIGQKVLLAGYGCVDSNIHKGKDGILRVGQSTVTRLPSGKKHWFSTEQDAALCFGDSGGPVMYSAYGKNRHSMIGVNSMGNINDLSLFTALFTDASVKFMSDFARDNEVDICGMTKKC